MNLYLQLFLQFFHVGVFSFGVFTFGAFTFGVLTFFSLRIFLEFVLLLIMDILRSLTICILQAVSR